ncbi:hypothetical protein LP419_21120 [Massilia sp. H-1]|nr:hypothetical protein LP419_21120 [Massilia sp. H-1]
MREAASLLGYRRAEKGGGTAVIGTKAVPWALLKAGFTPDAGYWFSGIT